MKKRLAWSVAVAGALSLAGWWFGWFGGDPVPADVRAMQAKLADPNASEADRRAAMEQIRTRVEALPPAARRAVWQSNQQMFGQREEARIDQILAMSPAQRTKALDAEIDQMERRRAEAAKRQQQREAQRAASTAKGSPTGATAARGQGRQRGPRTDEQRINRLRSRLDRGTPESRAKRAEYTRLINERRKQRGLPPTTGRGR